MSWYIYFPQEVKEVKEVDIIKQLYMEKSELIKNKKSIMLQKQTIDKQYEELKVKITEVDEKIKSEVNSGLETAF